MRHPTPILVTQLFPKLDEALIRLLTELTPDEWSLPTIAKAWTVKDIAAHLLDGNIRALSASRDNYFSVAPGRDEPLLAFLNRINAEWVTAMQRVSPSVLVELLRHTGPMVSAHYTSMDLFAPAIFPVAWAGEQSSLNWMHLAREYTEKFIHQQQIRHATNRPGIITAELFQPFISTLMLALPNTFRNTEAAEGTVVAVCVSGDAGGEWKIVRSAEKWTFTTSGVATASVHMGPELAWQLFSKGITPEESLPHVAINGDERLAVQALQMVSVMA